MMRYVVLFTTYDWDDFVFRQYQRLSNRVKNGSIFVVADETRSKLNIPRNINTFRLSEFSLRNSEQFGPYLDKAETNHSSLFWWNLDYLTIKFKESYPDFDYYMTVDFDARIELDIDALIHQIYMRKVDLAAEPTYQNIHDWHWYKTHFQLYKRPEIIGRILCITVMSNRAVSLLANERRILAEKFETKTVNFWPFCDVFVPTEIQHAGYKLAPLSDFGDAKHCAFRPIHREVVIDKFRPSGFIHPVYDSSRIKKALRGKSYPIKYLLNPFHMLAFLGIFIFEYSPVFALREKRTEALKFFTNILKFWGMDSL